MAGEKDRIKGKADEVIGAARKKAGRINSDERMEAEGTVQEMEGKMEGTIGKLKRKLSK